MKNTWKWILGGSIIAVIVVAVVMANPQLQKGAFPGPDLRIPPLTTTYVNREELAKMLVQARSFELVNPAVPTYSDVPVIHPNYKYIETALAHGFMQGYPDGTFRPNQTVLRAEFAAYAWRAFSDIPIAPYVHGVPFFSDIDPVGHAWFANNVNILYAIGVIKVQYRPTDRLERTFAQEVIANLVRLAR